MKSSAIIPVTIVGGGITGIATAIALAQAGVRPLLIERQSQLGGRARSIFLKKWNIWLDNGQHALSTAYPATLQLLRTLNTVSHIAFQSRLCVQFYYPHRPPFTFQAQPYPAPLHFVLPILRHPQFSLKERWQMATGLLRLFIHSSTHSDAPLQRFFARRDALYHTIIDAMALAALNTPASVASSTVFQRTLLQGFLKAPRYGALGVPNRPLHQLLGHPAHQWIQQHGGTVLLNTRVTALRRRPHYWEVHTSRRMPIKTRTVVLTLPPWQFRHLLPFIQPVLPPSVSRIIDALPGQPILTLYLWFEHPLPIPAISAFPYGPFQWVFPLPEACNFAGYGYALVISSPPTNLLTKNAAALAQLARHQLMTQIGLPPARVKPVAFFTMKEKRATIPLTPQTHHLRPAPGEIAPGLFIAGDWTQTGLPATLESAVQSAHRVSRQLLARG